MTCKVGFYLIGEEEMKGIVHSVLTFYRGHACFDKAGRPYI